MDVQYHGIELYTIYSDLSYLFITSATANCHISKTFMARVADHEGNFWNNLIFSWNE